MAAWRTISSFVVGLCVLGNASAAAAQIVDVLGKLNEGEDGFHGELGVSFGFKSGNTTLVQAKAELGLSYRYAEHVVYLVGRARFGTKQPIEKLSVNSFDKDFVHISQVFEHLRYRYEVRDWLGLEGFLQHEADKFRDLGTRFLAGGGPRLTAEPFDGLYLAVGLAYMFEHERYNASLIPSATSHRLSTYVQIDFALDETFSLHDTTFVQPRFAGDTPVVIATGDAVVSDLRISSDTALQIKVNTWLTVKLSFRVGFNSTTPPQLRDVLCAGKASAQGDPTRVVCVDAAGEPAGTPPIGLNRDAPAVRPLDVGFDTAFVLSY